MPVALVAAGCERGKYFTRTPDSAAHTAPASNARSAPAPTAAPSWSRNTMPTPTAASAPPASARGVIRSRPCPAARTSVMSGTRANARAPTAAPPPAPPTRREEVVDTVHGERLADPYRWLEDDGSDRVREWTDAQNARTRTVLDAIPQRAHFARRIGELLSVGLVETPRPIAGKIFHVRRAGAQKQHALYVRDAAGGTDAVAV